MFFAYLSSSPFILQGEFGVSPLAYSVAFAEGAAFQYLFVNKLGLDVKLNMVVWILFGIWNAVNDPIYGFLADRTKSKLGRRIPWIRYGSPILAVIYAVIWIIFPGTEGNQIFLFFQELIGLFLFDILYIAIAIGSIITY